MKQFSCLFVLTAGIALGQNSTSVPSAYQSIYSTLMSQVSSFDSAVRADWNGSSSPVVYAPQLETASAAQFTTLLETDYYADAVLPELEELQALGAKGVDVHISFPILYEPFYSSNPSQYQQFVSFYQQLAKDVHARGMKLIVESVVENVFPGDDASSFATYYKSLSWSAYMTGRAQNVLNTALLIQPDYMSVLNQPDSEASYTGQTTVDTVSGATQLLQTILSSLKSGGVTLPIGAGVGTWLASFTDYIQSFLTTSVSYIDLNIYPINNSDLTNAITAASQAHAAGKPVAISEAWDYKLSNSEVGSTSLLTTCSRDVFSFWAPLDTAFLDALADFANYEKLLFLSPFWSHYFHAYLNYASYSTDVASTLFEDSETAAVNAEQIGAFTSTGISWMHRILSAPDTTPPATPAAPTASGVYPESVMVDWTATTDNVGVAAYNLYRNGTLVTTTSLLTYWDQNLTPGNAYTYTVDAFDASGNVSAKSAALNVTTTDTTPTSAPTGLKATTVGSNSITLSWKAPTTGASDVSGYWVLSGQSSATLHDLAQVTSATAYVDSDVQPGKTYYFEVKAINLLGLLSDASSMISVTTPSD